MDRKHIFELVSSSSKKLFRKNILFGDLAILIMLALARVVLHSLTNGQYGFHRDELGLLDNARHLAWGYVEYPPLTPFIAHVGLALFGSSLVGLRLFSALAQGAAMVLAGLISRELGGTRRAQIITSLAVAIAPISLIQSALLQYVSFDYLWWIVIAYFMIRLLKSEDPRWWLGTGVVIGLGMLTKYTMAYFVAGLVVGVLLTNARRYLTSSWLWVGIALSLLIFAPNLIWQVQHNFISLQFLLNIHARDVAAGRTAGYLAEQFYVATNLFTVPFWAAGLYFYLSKLAGKPYRILGWMYLIPFALFLVTQGRSYYLAPAYPMLVAAGVVVWEQWVASLPITRAHLAHGLAWGGLAAGAVIFIPLMLPFAPINSALWDLTSKVHDNFVEEIGWPDMVKTVADIYTTLPLEEQHGTAILTGNYGEAGAVDLYGPAYGLPQAISGINSYWLRGYGDPPPGTLIVIGFSLERVEEFFTSCDLAGHVTNRYSVENEETRFHLDIFLCRGSRQPWPNLWDLLKSFG